MTDQKEKIYKAHSTKEAIEIVLKMRNKSYFIHVETHIHVKEDEDKYQPSFGSIQVSRDHLVRLLKDKYGLFRHIDKEREDGYTTYLKITEHEYCTFIG